MIPKCTTVKPQNLSFVTGVTCLLLIKPSERDLRKRLQSSLSRLSPAAADRRAAPPLRVRGAGHHADAAQARARGGGGPGGGALQQSLARPRLRGWTQPGLCR